MMHWQALSISILMLALACSSSTNTESAETSSETTSSETTSSEGESETETETGGEDGCGAMQAALEPCATASLRGFVWDGQACVFVEGCACMGPDCGELFGFEPDLFNSDAPRNTAEHACWAVYIELGCMTDPCDCPAGEFCVRHYDGTCLSGPLQCTPMPAGCETNPKDCASGCPDLICDEGASECTAPPCGGEWDNAIYCYGG